MGAMVSLVPKHEGPTRPVRGRVLARRIGAASDQSETEVVQTPQLHDRDTRSHQEAEGPRSWCFELQAQL
jgi:hypothetical protein